MASPIPAFPLAHSPRCRRCGNPASPMNRHICYGSRIRSNAGRPYYVCSSSSAFGYGTGYGAEGCGNFVTFDDGIGIAPTNPPCDCGWAARRGISRKGQVFYGCPVGACGFFSWCGDEDDEEEELVEPERVVVKVVQKTEEVQRPQEFQVQEIQEVEEVHEVQEVQRMPEVQAVQELHQVDEDHHVHEVHQVHQAREDQEVQKVHQVPEAHEARKVHEVEENNEVHDVQDVHDLHEEEETTDNDEDYDEWGTYSHEGDEEDSDARSYRIPQANSLRRFPAHEDKEEDEPSEVVEDRVSVPVPTKQEVEDEKGPTPSEPGSVSHAQSVTYEPEPVKQEVEHVHQQLFMEAKEDTPQEKAMVPALREVRDDVEWGVVGNEWPLVRTASPPRRRRRCCWFF